jgi:ribonuclease E
MPVDEPAAETAPSPAEAPPAPSTLLETPAEDDANKPRRTGWWAKRVFGKG